MPEIQHFLTNKNLAKEMHHVHIEKVVKTLSIACHMLERAVTQEGRQLDQQIFSYDKESGTVAEQLDYIVDLAELLRNIVSTQQAYTVTGSSSKKAQE